MELSVLVRRGRTALLACLLVVLSTLSSRSVGQDFSTTDAGRVREAQAALDASQYQRAVDLLRSLQPRYSGAPELPQMLAHAYVELGQFDNARQAALDALRLGRLSPDVLARLAQVYQQADDQIALMNAVRLLALLEPDAARWRMIYGDLLAAEGLLAESVAVFEDLLTEQPDSAELALRLANVQMQLGRLSDAVVSFETARHLGASNPQLPLTVASLWQQLDAPRQALQWYERHLAESGSADANVQMQIAQLQYELQDYRAASEAAKPLTESDDAAIASQAHVLLGQIAVDQERVEEAIRHWQRAIEQGMQSRPLTAAIGAHFFNKGEYETAARYLRRAAEGGGPAEQHVRFLVISLIRTGNFAEARSALQRYVEHHGFTDEAKKLVQLWADAAA